MVEIGRLGMRIILECFRTFGREKTELTKITGLQREPPKFALSQNRSCTPVTQKIATLTLVVNPVATRKLRSCI
jgi:hypothetical protein